MARDKEAEKEFLDKLALYRDSFEEFAHELPNDVGRNLSKVREVNHQQHRLINSLNVLKDELTNKVCSRRSEELIQLIFFSGDERRCCRTDALESRTHFGGIFAAQRGKDGIHTDDYRFVARSETGFRL